MRAIDTKAASKLLFINQTSLILLAPALYAASIYMILKRLIIILDAQRYSLVRVSWLIRFFVGCDVLSFLTQGAGMYSHYRVVFFTPAVLTSVAHRRCNASLKIIQQTWPNGPWKLSRYWGSSNSAYWLHPFHGRDRYLPFQDSTSTNREVYCRADSLASVHTCAVHWKHSNHDPVDLSCGRVHSRS